ncbi:MAG: hypothetical protein ABIH76_04820 [Candidatus Bathyarchaeota archaeon]
MGRRRKKKVTKIVKRTLPKIFVCPKCGGRSVKVNIDRTNQTAQVQCSKCNLKGQIDTTSKEQPVDIYCKFSDLFYARAIH